MHSTLLQTKLNRPRLTHDLVQRPRLFERLDQGLNTRLILVSAPAGFGKTTLVSSWIENLTNPSAAQISAYLPAAWLTLDRGDNDQRMFLSYLVAALQRIVPEACSDTNKLLKAARTPPWASVVDTLSNEIEQMPGEFILVLDDFHKIEGKAIPDLLDHLLLHWPDPLHLVLITRNNPALPLARWRAGGMLTEIRSRDLRFTLDETVEFFDRTLQTSADEAIVERLRETMDGWIAALRLVALSQRYYQNFDNLLASIEVSEDSLTEYLIDEVLENQLPFVQGFLLRTSILERFSASLCQAVLSDMDPAWDVRTCIDWLEASELFIISLDDRREWYRYHHLFQDFLQRRLEEILNPEEIRQMHTRAAKWFEINGSINEAIQHALSAGNLELAISLMEHGLREALNSSDRWILENWLRLIPGKMIDESPWLLMIKAWTLHFSWQTKALTACLNQAIDLLDKKESEQIDFEQDNLLYAQIAALRAQELYFHGQYDLSQKFLSEVLVRLPNSWKFLRGGAVMYAGMCKQSGGYFAEAEELLMEAYENQEDKADPYALRALHGLCQIYFNQGMLENCRQWCQTLITQAVKGNSTFMLSWARFLLGAVHYFRNELESAESNFMEVVQNPYTVHQVASQNSKYGLAKVLQSRGDSLAANQLIQQTAQIDIERMGVEDQQTRSLRAWLAFQQDNLESAYYWMDGFSDPIQEHTLFGLEEPHLTKSRILLSRRTREDLLEALRLLDELYLIAVKSFNVRYQIEILTTRAVALDLQGASAAAKVALEEALKLSRKVGYIQVFIEHYQGIATILKEISRQADFQDLIAKLEAVVQSKLILTSKNKNSPPDQGSIAQQENAQEPLTLREREVLTLLLEPLSLKEIAFKLKLSYSTVKRHSINAYKKLGVNNRWDAVVKATSLGEIPFYSSNHHT